MGVMGDRLVGDYYGTKIEVEGSATGLGGVFRLIIDNTKTDDGRVSVGGSLSLRGKLSHDGVEKPVVVAIKQGWFSTKFKLLVDESEHPIQRLE